MHRSAPRLTRILACAAVPVMLVAAGCSSDSDGDSAAKKSPAASASPEAAKSPTVAPAKYTKLPDPCKAVSAKTIEKLVPEVKKKAGTPGKSTDVASRAGCSWNGLDDKGLKGSNYHWIDIALVRYDSEATLGSGEQRAEKRYAERVAEVKATEGATELATSPAGVGDTATAFTYNVKKSGETFTYAVVVTRTANAVVTVSYNGTGYAGAKNPSPSTLMKGTVTAAKEAVTSIATANG
ncbi:DUF3558 family protein [Streptomyces sp. NPDC047928]|uniref:DUF3558 family protein n=1 Tax=unclassified Streptomyces TaxID=2593676 RepID=UPI00371A809C